MDRIRITGGQRLSGKIPISGAKNAALPLMIASLLTDQTLILDNVPALADVRLLVGGIIPETDVPKLLELGVARVFGPGTTMQEIVEFLRQSAPGSAGHA